MALSTTSRERDEKSDLNSKFQSINDMPGSTALYTVHLKVLVQFGVTFEHWSVLTPYQDENKMLHDYGTTSRRGATSAQC